MFSSQAWLASQCAIIFASLERLGLDINELLLPGYVLTSDVSQAVL